MATPSASMAWLFQVLLVLGALFPLGYAVPMPQAADGAAASSYWVGSIKRQGTAAFGGDNGYQVYRNVKDFGAKGDGSTDDTDAINAAISSGNRCGNGCDSSTVDPALVYFPPGTYVVSKPIIQYYYTQLVGDAVNLPVIKAAASFTGMAVIDSDPYTNTGQNWYTNQNNFFRQVRNFVIDLTGLDKSTGAGIHWQVAQATSLQNIRFEMVRGGGEANKQQGIFMDNGSGGFMTDLVFNGGNYGAFLGNQQFTTRNLTFNGCNTAIFMNWNWAWTFKSITVNDCGVALNMSNSPTNQTVGSVLILDSVINNTPKGVVTAFTGNSIPETGGTLILDNVDFTSSDIAVMGIDGKTILAGKSHVENFVQGNTYTPGSHGAKAKRDHVAQAVPVIVKEVHVRDTCKAPEPAPQPNAGGPGSAQNNAPQTAPPAVTSGNTVISTSIVTSYVTAAPSSVSNSPASPSPSQPAGGAGSSSSQFTCSSTTVQKARVSTSLPAPTKPKALLDGSGKVVERAKPQYENVPASSFVSVKSAGAKGDGKTDDTAAIQKVLDSATEGQIVYFDHGAYVITSTLKVPKNIKITGEIWPLLMASGEKFSDMKNPIPLLQVGQPGDEGNVELSDLMLETKGPAPGAIMVEWNVAGSTPGSAGMWDVHVRIGGSAGTELQSDKCAKTPNSTTTPKPECFGAFMLLHVTESGSGYFENTWYWVADHELDMSDHGQINIYNGRGVLIESKKPVWMYGTASEHNTLYNYQIDNAQNVYMALIQTETPYFQSNPNALVPFTPNPSFNDPDFSTCTTDSCRKAWGLRILKSSDIFLYGGGLYSFFENYHQECLETESCQENMVQVDCSDTVYLYALSTKASTNMVTGTDGKGLVPQGENRSNFCSTVALFSQAGSA